MNDLYVQEAVRGEGVADQLFTSCKEYAARHGYANMSWTTAGDNHRAQRFYDKMGGELGEWLSYSMQPTLGVGD
ncbi:Acetyltransferase (GNAT) family protein [compost metagenome]